MLSGNAVGETPTAAVGTTMLHKIQVKRFDQ